MYLYMYNDIFFFSPRLFRLPIKLTSDEKCDYLTRETLIDK